MKFIHISAICLCYVVANEAAFTRNDTLYGPRYKPLWKKGAKTPLTSIFGASAVRRLIEGFGFKYENYTVETEDGYFLNLNRMVHPDKIGKKDKGYPLLLVNGFTIQSEGWLVQDEMDSNLAPVWSALGYDVWLLDNRGTMRSMRHYNLSSDPRDKRFWDYSFDEAGVYDTAATIDFVLKKTAYNDLTFVCISLGCSLHAILISDRPEYNSKVRGAVYFVPLLNNIQSYLDMPLPLVAQFANTRIHTYSFDQQGIHTYIPQLGTWKKELYYVCRPFTNALIFGSKLAFHGAAHLEKSLCKQAALSIGGGSIKSGKHLLQVYGKGEFAKYDYGREENKKRYGQEAAPLYNLTKITSVVAMYYSDSDGYAPLKKAKGTLKSFGGPTYECVLPKFNHFDVGGGSTMKYILPDVNEFLDSLSGYSGDNKRKAYSSKCPSMEWVRNL